MTATQTDPARAVRRDRIAELVHDEHYSDLPWRAIVDSPVHRLIVQRYRRLADVILDLVEGPP